MAAECRRVALQEYSFDVQSRNYVKLYESLIAGAAGRAA
jgi:hypothetical protein